MVQYIDKSTTIAKIKEIYNEDYKFLPSDIVESVRDFKDDLLAALDTFEAKELKKETVSEELEEAAQEYVTKEGYLAGLHYNSMVRSFKAGAEWYASHNTKLPDNLLLAARKGIEFGLKVGNSVDNKAQKGK